MNGRVVGAGLIASAALAGGALYYLQVYHFYDRVPAAGIEIALTPAAGGAPEPIPVEDLQAVDATSSPIRFRACFSTPLSLAMLSETYRLYDAPVPLTAPGWFDCFDAAQIGAALETGEALAFLGVAGIAAGTDRVVAVYSDGRAFAWQQINQNFGE